MITIDYVKVGRWIAALRKKRGMTQEDVAGRLNISPQAISKWENGHTMPELPLFAELAGLLGCTIDEILFPVSRCPVNANFEHILLPYAPVGDFTGRIWPRSMAVPAILSAVKLFMGLEKHLDSMGRQINDDTEYILQSAFSSICFGYSWEPERSLENCLRTYGLKGEVHGREKYSEEEFVHIVVNHILSGYPVIVKPREYTDMILATGFSHQGKVLKGIPFWTVMMKNSVMSFRQLRSFPEWYVKDSDLVLIKPGSAEISAAVKCREALENGCRLLSNKVSISEEPLAGYGLVMYDNWCNELRKENNRNLVTIECLIPHIFIHYEGKLRTKQFLELCMQLVEGMDSRPLITAISKYEEIIEMCEKCMNDWLPRTPENAAEAVARRQGLIGILQRSRELEAEALKAVESVI